MEAIVIHRLKLWLGPQKIRRINFYYLTNSCKLDSRNGLDGPVEYLVEYIKHTIWPAAKVRLLYWWWIVKYGGKKKIPPEVIFGRIEETVKSLSDSIYRAIQVSPENMTKEEGLLVHDLLVKVKEFKEETSNLNNK